MVGHLLIPVSENFKPTGVKPQSLDGTHGYRHFISEEAFKKRVELNRTLMQKSPSKQNADSLTHPADKAQPVKEDQSRDKITEYMAWLNGTVRLLAGKQSVSFTRSAEQEAVSRSDAQKPAYDDLAGFPSEADEVILQLLKTLPGVNLTLPTRGDASVFAALSARATSLERTVQGMMQLRQNLTVASVDALNKHTTLYPALPAKNQERSYIVQRRYQISTLVNNLFGESNRPTQSAARTQKSALYYDGTAAPIELPADLIKIASVSSASLANAPANYSGRSQSLLAQKFAAEDADFDPDADPNAASGLSPSDEGRASDQLPSNPHFDYRIMHGQALRTRAKDIYSTSVTQDLPTSSAWCARHRVQQCSTCTSLFTGSTSALTDKAELSLLTSKRRESLAALISDFLILSSSLFVDLAQDSVGPFTPDTHSTPLPGADAEDSAATDKRKFCASSAWYKLLLALVTQACLNGYLTEGWTGIEAIDVLLGVGCGGWDGRMWNRRRVVVQPSASSSGSGSESSEDEDSDDDDEEPETNDKLIEAAQMLFSVRSAAQAEFEREMRDRKHEFLDVPEATSLEEHLSALSIKYSLSNFEALACQFFQAIDSMLGQPSLVSTYTGTQPVVSRRNSIPNPQSMSPFMTRFYAESRHSLVESLSETRPTTSKRKPSLSREDDLPSGSRVKVDL